jgi:ABC-type multidrug transport system fused ATPase/permease subunit
MELMKVLTALRGRKTIVTIAHRVNSLANFDEIHLFEDGRIVASGPYGELVQTSSSFRHMVEHFAGA